MVVVLSPLSTIYACQLTSARNFIRQDFTPNRRPCNCNQWTLFAVCSGIFGKPIVAVPTSVGYGASFNGIAPLLTMLNSCSPGVVVVNIDNGFGAGYFASMINK